MNAATIVLLVSIAASLVLAVRSLRAHGVSPRGKIGMAAAWLVIIAAAAFVFARIGA